MSEETEIPTDWDALSDRETAMSPEDPPPPDEDNRKGPPLVTVMATSWADLVAILAVCTAALLAILLMGERPAIPAFAWAAGLAVIWWVFAAAALVVVRHGTPGMLLAGVKFEVAVPPERVPWVLAAALVGVLTGGLTGLLGSENSLLGWAGGSVLSLVDEAP